MRGRVRGAGGSGTALRRCAVAACLLLLPVASGVGAPPPPYRVLSSITLPPSFYVGDHVELRVRLETANPRELRPPAHMPSNSWIHIDSISLSRGNGSVELRIFFASYAPGEEEMPPIDLGAFTVTGLKVSTASVIEGVARLTGPKGQLLLPGSTLFLALLVAFLAAIPLAGFLLFGRILPYLRSLLEERRARKPWRRFSAALVRLERSAGDRPAREFYIELCAEIRSYLSALTGGDFRAVTAREFSRTARRRNLSAGPAERFGTVMSFADLVKFADHPAGAEERMRDLTGVRSAAGELEEERRRRLAGSRRAAPAGSERGEAS